MARCDTSHLCWRTWIRIQMEHGLDARFPALYEHRSDLPEVSSQQHHFLAALRVSREFYPRAQSRRNRLRQALAVIQNAGRRMAEVCQSPHVSGVDVRAPRQKVAFHGWRIRSTQRVEPRHAA